jgi:hypothetical protein
MYTWYDIHIPIHVGRHVICDEDPNFKVIITTTFI